jgi:hypothetical protein
MHRIHRRRRIAADAGSLSRKRARHAFSNPPELALNCFANESSETHRDCHRKRSPECYAQLADSDTLTRTV